jgi:HEAT repeat protein
MRPILLLAALLALVCTGCTGGRRYDNELARPDQRVEQIAAEVAALAHGKDVDDPESSVAYDQAVQALIGRGSAVEPQLIEGLRGDPDWGVRLGCIEVMQAVGGRSSIEPLLESLLDPVPLVAHRAHATLRSLLAYDPIPATGQPSHDGLDPLPERPAGDLAMDAELRIWTAWLATHGPALKAAWTAWWKANHAQVNLE